MSGRRDELLLISDMIDAVEHLLDAAGRTERGRRCTDSDISRAILYDLVVLGEAAKRFSGETRRGNPHIPWRRIAETRDRIVHHYEGVDWAIVDLIIENDLPNLLIALRATHGSLLREPRGE